MPPRVRLEDGEARAGRRLWFDEQRSGIRTPWVPVGLRWTFADMEPVWQAAEIGNLDPLARVVEAMRSEGVTAGLMEARCVFVKRPCTFQGDPYLCDLLRGTPPVVRNGRVIKPGRKGIFRRMHPTAALLDLVYTAILAGMAVAEYVDDPVSGLPVLQTRDLHRLRYDWGDRAWKYRGERGEYIVNPGDGRWIFFCPKSTHRPWRSGSWLPLMLAFVVMITTTYDAARFQAKNADPLKTIEVPDEVPPDEVDRLEEFVTHWWERAPGIVLRYGAKADLVETNGIGHHIYTAQREWAKQQINFTLRGSMGTSGESAGILNDNEAAADVAQSMIQDIADSLGECLSEQGIAPWFLRCGLVTRADEAPSVAWDTRSAKAKLSEAEAAGALCDVIGKLDVIGKPRGQRVDVDAFFAQAGLTIPWQSITAKELLDADGNALWSDESEVALPAPEATTMGLLPEASTVDSATDQTTPAGSLQ